MTKFLSITLAALGLLIGPPAMADDEYDALLEEFEDAQQQYYDDMSKAFEAQEEETKAQEGEAVVEAFDMTKMPPNPAEKFVARFEAYAEKHAGKPEAIAPLGWIVNNATPNFGPDGPSDDESPADRALDRLTRDHAAHAQVKDVLPGMRYATYAVKQPALTAFYKKIIKKNKDKDALAGATFNLAFTLYRGSPFGHQDEKSEAKGQKKAMKLFRKIVKKYAESDVIDQAKGYIFEIEHLQIGMIAPEIVGTDVDDKEIKLSQFRGQVVVLDFWGFW